MVGILVSLNFLVLSLTSKRLVDQKPQGCLYKKNKSELMNHPDIQPGGERQIWDIEGTFNLSLSFNTDTKAPMTCTIIIFIISLDLVSLGNDVKGNAND